MGRELIIFEISSIAVIPVSFILALPNKRYVSVFSILPVNPDTPFHILRGNMLLGDCCYTESMNKKNVLFITILIRAEALLRGYGLVMF